MNDLSKSLEDLSKSTDYPFHMPGHKRRVPEGLPKELADAYRIDITEIDGFDNLHDPRGILAEAQMNAADIFGAEESFFLVNGSSCGILAALRTVLAGPDQVLLMGRNAHRSVYNGLYLSGAHARYLYPERLECGIYGGITSQQVREALEKERPSAVLITSPTYEGIVSPIEEIAEVAHAFQVPLIVDEAHGAHLSLWGDGMFFPKSAVTMGADLVIQSLHKTLPAMTQTAILHVSGNRIDRETLRQHLAMFQTSSPSYVLMSSITSALDLCARKKDVLGKAYRNRLCDFYEKTNDLSHLQILFPIGETRKKIQKDPGKLLIATDRSSISGPELHERLRTDYHLQPEMAAGRYVLAMTSVSDSEEGMKRLISALHSIDGQIGEAADPTEPDPDIGEAEEVLSISEALRASKESVLWKEAAGRISAEYAYFYPPGIPLIVPGERISTEVLSKIEEGAAMGLTVIGPNAFDEGRIACVTGTGSRYTE